MDYTGYRQAFIHLAWFRDDALRHLLFGMIELRPNEFPDAVGCPTKNLRIGSKGRRCLHYRRFVLPAADAIGWYEAAARDNPVLPSDPKYPTPGDGAKLEGGPFVQEPLWPHLAASKELVFAPDWMQDSRTHFLFPKHDLPSSIDKLINTCSDLRTSDVVLENIAVFGSDYLRTKRPLGSHYLRMSAH